MSLPEVRIKDGFLLREKVSQHLHELWSKDGETLAGDEEMAKIVEAYQSAWQPYESKILTGMTNEMGLTFHQNTIDVYIAPWFFAFSDPLVIGVTYSPERFVEILTHEILHRLLTDNNETTAFSLDETELQILFGNDLTFNTLIHIPVHAIMQFVFDDVLNEPKRTVRDRDMCSKYDDYRRAWEYVDATGYKVIIEKLKTFYIKSSAK